MKNFLVFIFTCFASSVLAIPNYEDFSKEKPGFVIKLNGDTLKGSIRILDEFPHNYFNFYKDQNLRMKIVPANNKQLFISFNELKLIQYGKDAYKVFALTTFPYGTYIAKQPDSLQIVAIYKAYEFVLKVTETATNLFSPIPSVSYFRIKELYLIQVGNLPPEVFYSPTFKEYPYTVRDIDFTKFEPEIIEATIGLNYKKRLKELFYSKPEAYAYVKSLKDIKYNELPVIAAQINKLYK